MKFALKTAHGWLSLQPTGALEFRALTTTPGAYETFETVDLGTSAPVPTHAPSWPPVINGDYHTWFLKLVEGRPFSMDTLQALSDEGALASAGVVLSPRNANHELTKIGLLNADGSRTWVRVGFGEGHWVWMVQHA